MITMTSCAQMIPGIDQVLEDFVTDEAIQVTVDKAAMKDNTSVTINVSVTPVSK